MLKKYLCFNQITEGIKIEDTEAFVYYLGEIYVRISKKDKERLTYYKLAKYIDLPTFIAKKVYRNFDKNASNKIDGEEYIRSLLELYSDDYYILTKTYYDILDFTKVGKIFKSDVKIFLHHMKEHADAKVLKDTINNIIYNTFGDKDYITYREFLDLIENMYSDLFFIMFMYFHEKQPFTNNVIKFIYSLSDVHNTHQLDRKMENSTSHLKRNNNDIISEKNKNIKTINESFKKMKEDAITSRSVQNLKTGASSFTDLRDENTKHLLICPTSNIIIFSSEERYNKLKKFVLNYKIDKDSEVDDIPNEINGFFYVRSLPLSLQFKIKKAATTRASLFFKKANDKSKLFNEDNKEGQSENSFLSRISRMSSTSINKSINSKISVPRRQSNSKIVDKYIDQSSLNSVQKSDLLHHAYTVEIENIFSKEENEYGTYVYKKIKTKYQGQFSFEKTWLSVVQLHLFYNRNNIRKVHHLSIAEVITNTPKEENVKDGRIYYFSVSIYGKIKTFYCKKENDCQQLIDYIKKIINQRSIHNFYKLGETIHFKEGIEYVKALCLKTKQIVLVKVIKKEDNELNEDFYAEIKNEIDIMKMCNHSNIQKYIEDFEDNSNIYIVTEYIYGGEINYFLQQNGEKITDDKKKAFTYEIIKGLDYLHELGILHRCLVPESIWMNVTNYLYALPKIIDFRNSIVLGLSENTVGRYGQKNFMAPEVHADGKYNNSIDIWSFGCLIYYIFSGYTPFSEIKDMNKRTNAILYKDITFPKSIWPEKYDAIKEIIQKCMNKDPEMRCKVKYIIDHPMFQRFKQLI